MTSHILNMTSCTSVMTSLNHFLSAAILLLLSVCEVQTVQHQTYIASACYGTVYNNLDLRCQGGKVISVFKVTHGVKVKAAGCPIPAGAENYRPECCRQAATDCGIDVPPDVVSMCNGHVSCEQVATWSNAAPTCSAALYDVASHYMNVLYECVPVEGQTTPNTSQTTPPPRDVTTSTRDVTSDVTNDVSSTSSQDSQLHLQKHAAGDDDELSDGMIGAIVGCSIGMLLIFVVFVFYWGRRRTLRIVTKRQPTVWDYLLPSTFTVSTERGYDHFPSVRSQHSSTGSVGSHNTWLPNIAPGDADLPDDDAASVYDNNIAVTSSPEVHQATPTTTSAILNLDVNIDNVAPSHVNQNFNVNA